MIKILFIIDTLAGGGLQRRLTEILKQLSQDPNFKIELIVLDDKVHYKSILELDIKIHYLKRRSKMDLSLFNRILRISRSFDPDIIHSWHRITTFFAIPSKIFGKKKMINNQIADAPSYVKLFSVSSILSRINYNFSDLIISNSKAGLVSYRAPTNKSIYIHNGFDFKRTKNLISEKEIRNNHDINTPFIVGMFANYSELKDYNTYVEAAIKIISCRNDVTFIAAGKDLGAKSEIEKKCNSSGFKGKIKLLSEQTDIESYINILTIGVLCSSNKKHSEGISNSILEYMGFGKPVIASVGGGTSELMINNKTGYIIDSNDPDSLTEKILYLLDNESVARQFGLAGRRRIENEFKLENKINEYTEQYFKILKITKRQDK
jgi:glycosyltransferase involved in cell wall biosynthesis